MCNEEMLINPLSLPYVSDRFKTNEMFIKAVEEYPRTLDYVPNQYKTHKICDAIVKKRPWLLIHVPDWFITKERHRVPHGRQEQEKQKSQKSQIREDLISIAWHP